MPHGTEERTDSSALRRVPFSRYSVRPEDFPFSTGNAAAGSAEEKGTGRNPASRNAGKGGNPFPPGSPRGDPGGLFHFSASFRDYF
ncbi:hypothetical protein HMPREF1326_00874 [Akkermansia sp. KLE1605]|nr:hypothetical protein HMPREF1326_00874 [Akkermansia sp. KLE1605]